MQNPSPVLVVSPSRTGLLRFAARQVLVLALGVALILLRDLRPAESQIVGLLGILACLISLSVLLACVYRMVVPRPSLIINAEGITDNCSLLVCGVGLIRWSAIRTLYPIDYQRSPVLNAFNFTDRFLMITPVDLDALLAASHPLVRGLRRPFRFVVWSPPGVSIPHWMLSQPVGDVTVAIRKYYDTLRAVHHASRSFPPIAIPW